MDLGLQGKTALVVGASRGLGRDVALKLAQEGTRVIAIARNEEDLKSLSHEMGSSQKHRVVAMDLVPEGAPARLAEILQSEKIEIIVHNLGGTLAVRDPLCSLEDFRRVMRLNVEIALELNRFFLPAMRERRWGRVVHVSSNAAIIGRGAMAYGAAKATLNAYTENLGKALAAEGVVLTSVMPGPIVHEGSHWDNLSKTQPENVQKYLQERTAIKRFAEVTEISQFIVYLCSAQASYFAGNVLAVDGGGN